MLNIKKTLTKILDALKADYVVEQGTSGDWIYRKWYSGLCEAWGTETKSIACTVSSPYYGGYRTDEIQYTIPSGIFNATPTYCFGEKSVVDSLKLMNVTANSATELGVYYGSGQNMTISSTVVFYVLGTWK